MSESGGINKQIDKADVFLWGTRIAQLLWQENKRAFEFQYAESFLGFAIELSPFAMPVRQAPYTFSPADAWLLQPLFFNQNFDWKALFEHGLKGGSFLDDFSFE